MGHMPVSPDLVDAAALTCGWAEDDEEELAAQSFLDHLRSYHSWNHCVRRGASQCTNLAGMFSGGDRMRLTCGVEPHDVHLVPFRCNSISHSREGSLGPVPRFLPLSLDEAAARIDGSMGCDRGRSMRATDVIVSSSRTKG